MSGCFYSRERELSGGISPNNCKIIINTFNGKINFTLYFILSAIKWSRQMKRDKKTEPFSRKTLSVVLFGLFGSIRHELSRNFYFK